MNDIFRKLKIYIGNKLNQRIVMGEYSYGKPIVVRYSGRQKVIIGKYCSIAPNVKFLLLAKHRADWVSTYPFGAFGNFWKKKVDDYYIEGSDIVVGNDVWIGYGATILSGVKIGDGAVIGANAVVARDVDNYSIVVGNPAHEVRKRFDNKTIAKLKKIQWWDWDEKKVRDNIKFIASNNIEGFLKIDGRKK